MFWIRHCLDNQLTDDGEVVSLASRPLFYSWETLFLCLEVPGSIPYHCCEAQNWLSFSMESVSLRVPTKKIMIDFGTVNMSTSNVCWICTSTRCIISTFSVNIISPMKIYIPLLNPTEFYHYHVTCMIHCFVWNSSLLLISISVLTLF
jgi:hypothetical protein